MLWAKRSVTESPSPSIFKMHTHDCYEIFVFYAGDACYHVEGTVYPLQAGDILIIWNLSRFKSTADEVVYMDHPTEAGSVVFER